MVTKEIEFKNFDGAINIDDMYIYKVSDFLNTPAFWLYEILSELKESNKDFIKISYGYPTCSDSYEYYTLNNKVRNYNIKKLLEYGRE